MMRSRGIQQVATLMKMGTLGLGCRGAKTKPRLATDRPRHYRRGLFAILVLGAFLSGCMRRAGPEFTFEQVEVVTGSAKRQTVLTGFLLGGAVAELAVVHIDENGNRRLRIYAFGDGTWAPILDSTLRPEVRFVDVANIHGRDRLLTYEHGLLSWFDPESATQRALLSVTSNHPPPRGEIPHLDVSRDVNGDHRDDLVVPDFFDGFRVFIQMSDGTFADPVKIGPSTEMDRIYGADSYRYDPWSESRVHQMDYNRDGRSDLVFWKEDHFEVHQQDERGLLAPVAKTFTAEVAFDSDDLSSLAAPHGVRRRRKDHAATGAMTGRVLHSLNDMNGDGVPDLVVFSLEGGSSRFLGQLGELWSMHSSYEVHFGTPTPDGTVFAPAIGTAILSDGIPFGLVQHDFDHDGQVDMMFATIDPGIFKVIGMLISALLTGSVSLDLEFNRMEGGSYPRKPNATRKIKTTSLGRSGEKTIFPSVLIGMSTVTAARNCWCSRASKNCASFSACRARSCSPGSHTNWPSPCPKRNTPGLWISTRTESRTSSCTTHPLPSRIG